ncbi:FAD-dependent oxidoreductase [Actinoplanes sp. NPDC026619]|uniref:NAD(P)/FAD-dependent oxidoreductase n=1 Tax=Actinoplanes sp. NPDC026619 TaxID=3155798 RepID=UPI0033FC2489
MRPIVVVGAGIVGASIAYHLARAGAPVVVIGRDAGVTAASFAWIGGDQSGDWPGGAAGLARFVSADWRRVEREVPEVGVRWCGSLRWPPEAGAPRAVAERSAAGSDSWPGSPRQVAAEIGPGAGSLRQAVAGSGSGPGSFGQAVAGNGSGPGSLRQAVAGNGSGPGKADGVGPVLVGADEIAMLEPHLRIFPEGAIYTAGDGGVDPVRAARALLAAAGRFGARLVSGATVIGIRADGVDSTVGFLPASAVVLAAGAGTAALARRATIAGEGAAVLGQVSARGAGPGPGTAAAPSAVGVAGLGAGGRIGGVSPALLIRIRADRAGLVRGIVASPGLEIREVRDRELLVAAALPPEWSWADLRDSAHRALRQLQDTFTGGDHLLRGWRVGVRPMPVGGPVIGWLTPDIYVAVMHSGVCLAPAVGRLVTAEIISDRPTPDLDGCRPAALTHAADPRR